MASLWPSLCGGACEEEEGDGERSESHRRRLDRAHTTLRSRVAGQRYLPATDADAARKLRLLHPLADDGAPLPPLAPQRHLPPDAPAKPRWVLHPSSWARQLWDTAALLLIYGLVLLLPVEIGYYQECTTWCAALGAARCHSCCAGSSCPRGAKGGACFQPLALAARQQC